ncbi:MAG TPA: MBL fold metallo-hydrolase [Gemmatimonadales bacterium]|nr:MBL fold metallo-hydrolase [Gemmatimonadales bacterium]
MTTLWVLGSGSGGNCCAIESGGAAVLIDAGFSAKEVERRAERVGLNLAGLAAIVLTHEHGDHAAGAARLARRFRVPVVTAAGTWASIVRSMRDAEHRTLGMRARVVVGPFTIDACPTSHDAAEPIAVAVRLADGTGVGVAYDLGRPTTAVRYLLRELTGVILESNYDDILLRTSDYPPSVQRRIAGSGGHLSNRAAAELLEELHHPGLGLVVLAHLSRHCNTPADARATVEPVLRRAGFTGTLHVACQDEPIGPLAVVPPADAQLGLML